jgi:6-phosphogluconolactonase
MNRTIMVVGGLNRSAPYFADAHGKGLSLFAFDEADATATPLCEVTGIDNPSYLSISAGGRFLYANSEVSGWPEGTVTAYAIDAAAPRLRALNMQSSVGSITAHSSFDATGRFLLVANYSLGPMDEGSNQAIAVLPVGADGRLGPAVSSVLHEGTGPNPDRQERPHPHCVFAVPDNRFVVVADLGLDALFAYPFDAEGRLDAAGVVRSPLPAGSGPRHFAFHGNGRLAVLICELDSTVASLRYDPATGRFETIGIVSAVPEGVSGSHCSGIQIHPNGRFVYGANRGHDSVAAFGLDAGSGALTPLGHTPCGGKTPRDMTIDPSGRFLMVCNQDSDVISVFAIDPGSGALAPAGRDIAIGTPMCVKFARIG